MSALTVLNQPVSQPDGFVSLTQLASTATKQRKPAMIARDLKRRELYLQAALAEIPRVIGSLDRNPYRATYGSFDRAFWHYRTSDFPSAMYQEAVLPLALVWRHEMPGNRWRHSARLRDLIVAALRYTVRSSHGNGACDDYFPYEQALGAAVFATNAAAHAYQLLELDDSELRAWFDRRARWIEGHHEAGRLTNHHALAAVALWRIAEITNSVDHHEAARDRIGTVLAWQSEEGWFDEYGGADPGYQTVTLDCLATYQRLASARFLDAAIHRGLRFARCFLHPDGSYGGVYGSRGTRHFYPHGMELLAARYVEAADLADGFLDSLATGRQASFSDDRMYAHRLGGLIEAWLDWSPERPAAGDASAAAKDFPRAGVFVRGSIQGLPHPSPLPEGAGIGREGEGNPFGGTQTIMSAARGGSFRHHGADGASHSDAGLIVEFEDQRVAVSQMHDRGRQVECRTNTDVHETIDVAGPLHWAHFETMSTGKLIVFRLVTLSVGRFLPGLVRRLLQRRLITGRAAAPIELSRQFEFIADCNSPISLRVVDTIELVDRRRTICRMSFGVDHEAAYVAASGVYQDVVLQPWIDLAGYIDSLNRTGRVTIVREFV